MVVIKEKTWKAKLYFESLNFSLIKLTVIKVFTGVVLTFSIKLLNCLSHRELVISSGWCTMTSMVMVGVVTWSVGLRRRCRFPVRLQYVIKDSLGEALQLEVNRAPGTLQTLGLSSPNKSRTFWLLTVNGYMGPPPVYFHLRVFSKTLVFILIYFFFNWSTFTVTFFLRKAFVFLFTPFFCCFDVCCICLWWNYCIFSDKFDENSSFMSILSTQSFG